MNHLVKVITLCALLLPSLASANAQPFPAWLEAFKQEAESKGISREVLNAAFSGVTPNPKVVALDRKQPESTKSFLDYVDGSVTASRISTGRAMMQKHAALLKQISEKYGVPARFIVALWGTETSFGSYTGDFSIIRSLATLAYDGRRSDFFRSELLEALRIIQHGQRSGANMTGSWAGAMGQSQFMPSSFMKFAIDENNDGKKDIWGTQADVFASIANYLKQSGWNEELTWGKAVYVPPSVADILLDGKQWKPLAEWNALGVRTMDGKQLPDKPLEAALTIPGQRYEGTFLIYRNYDVFLLWNRSRYFATAVGILSDKIQ